MALNAAPAPSSMRLCHVHGLVHASCRVDAGPARFVLEADEVRIRETRSPFEGRDFRTLTVAEVQDVFRFGGLLEVVLFGFVAAACRLGQAVCVFLRTARGRDHARGQDHEVCFYLYLLAGLGRRKGCSPSPRTCCRSPASETPVTSAFVSITPGLFWASL